jgi:hypothetical protein
LKKRITGRATPAAIPHTVKAQGQAGFTAMDFDKPNILEARLNSGKPRCPLVPCSVLLCFFYL